MKITKKHPSVRTKTWYLKLEDAPEISFVGKIKHSPSEVTVTSISNDGLPDRFYMEFTAPDVKQMGLYSSDENAVNPFSSLPVEFVAAIFKECI